MTAAAFDMPSRLTRWQRFLAWFLPWYHPDEQERRIRRTEELIEDARTVSDRIRIARLDAQVPRGTNLRRRHDDA
jgi:hypothetical protein